MLSINDLCSHSDNESEQSSYIDLVTSSTDPSKSPIDYLFFNNESNNFRVTKNITAAYCQLVYSIPETFPCHPNGYATIILNRSISGRISVPNTTGRAGISTHSSMNSITDTQGFNHSLLQDDNFSLNFQQSARPTTISLEGIKHKSTRRTATCSGSVECIYSTKSNYRCDSISNNSISQQFYSPDQPLVEDFRQEGCYQERLARQLFFYAQNKFPQVCGHYKTSSIIENHYYERQHRALNWRLVKGKQIARKMKVIGTGVHD